MFRPKPAAGLIATLILFLLPAALLSQVFIRAPAGTPNHLRAIDFIDDSSGLIAGDLGTLLRTTDGGRTWGAVPSGTTSQLLAVSWLSTSTAIAAGFNGLIIRSSDAGFTWTPVPSGVTLPLAGCASLDSLTATVVGYNGIVLRTTDGGASWTATPQQNGSNLLGVAYADSLTIVVTGSYGRILRTSDGGATWSTRSIGSFTLNDVAFTDPLRGVAVSAGGNTFLRTTDAGASWSPGIPSVTFDDIDRGPDGRLLAAGMAIASSGDSGDSWSFRAPPARLRAVAALDSGRYIAAGDNGVILRTADGPIDPPPPEPRFPADGETAAPLSAEWRREFSVTLSWLEYASFFPDSVHLQVGLDPGFSGTPFFDTAFRIGSLPDTARTVGRILPGKPHYWRMRVMFDSMASPWSATRTFTGSVAGALLTVRDIQWVPADSLILADSLTSIARDRWNLQTSRYLDSASFIVVRCATDAADLFDPYYSWQGASAGMFFYGIDTGATGPAWRGMKITPGWFSGTPDLVEAFSRVRRGDLVVCAGRVSEDPWTLMDSETSFYATWLFVLDSAGAIPGPAAASIGDFYFQDGGNLLPRYSAGEPFEGGAVELTHVTVHSTGIGPPGTFNVTTRDGLRIGTADYSRWFTLRSHSDPTSTYQMPFIGQHIDTLRGYVTAMSGDPQSWTFPRYRLQPVSRGDIVYGQPTGNVLRGRVFYDFLKDGSDTAQPGWEGWKLRLGGLVSTTLTTGRDGSFAAAGLDSGSYTLTIDLPEGWFLTRPDSGSVDFTLGLGDTVDPGPFGIYFGWDRISGTVFEDIDEDGAKGPDEPGMSGVRVFLGGARTDSSVTNAAGLYVFDWLERGLYTVSIRRPPQWEQILPANGGGHDVNFMEYNRHADGLDFSLRPTPFRVKLGITVRDANDEARRDIFFGTRPGASYGVWGPDTTASFIDFSEGEFEIPPQIFGLFDARFVDPRGGIESFGEGTWTDIREYRSPGQVDSFKIDFQPGLLLGGSYPMRFFWSSAGVESSYAGDVVLCDAAWNPILGMKTAGSLIVTDTSVGILTIIAEGPVLRLSDAPAGPRTIPSEFALRQNYPNPFNAGTRIPFDVPSAGRIGIRIYDILGREVAEILDGVVAPGTHLERWDPEGLPSGVYLCWMTAGEFRAVRKLLLVR